MNDRIAIIDTETTGLDPLIHPIWELAVITGGEEYHYFVDVTAGDLLNADPVALDINGFRERYFHVDAMSPEDLAVQLAGPGGLLDGKVIVGANPHFDLLRLRRWYETIGLDVPWHYRPICIESVLYGVNPGYVLDSGIGLDVAVPWRSAELYERLTGVTQPEGDQHTALGDARYEESQR